MAARLAYHSQTSPAGDFTMIPELETADFEAILAPLEGDQPTGR